MRIKYRVSEFTRDDFRTGCSNKNKNLAHHVPINTACLNKHENLVQGVPINMRIYSSEMLPLILEIKLRKTGHVKYQIKGFLLLKGKLFCYFINLNRNNIT